MKQAKDEKIKEYVAILQKPVDKLTDTEINKGYELAKDKDIQSVLEKAREEDAAFAEFKNELDGKMYCLECGGKAVNEKEGHTFVFKRKDVEQAAQNLYKSGIFQGHKEAFKMKREIEQQTASAILQPIEKLLCELDIKLEDSLDWSVGFGELNVLIEDLKKKHLKAK